MTLTFIFSSKIVTMQRNGHSKGKNIQYQCSVKIHMIAVDMLGNWKTKTVYDREETDGIIDINHGDEE